MTETLSLTFLKILGRIHRTTLLFLIHTFMFPESGLLHLFLLMLFKGMDVACEISKRTLSSRLIGPQICGVANSSSWLAIETLAILLLGVITATPKHLGLFLLS